LFDVDLLIDRAIIERAKIALHSIGLRQGRVNRTDGVLLDRDVADIARLEINHYELAPFLSLQELSLSADEENLAMQDSEHPLLCVNGRVYVVVEIDIHHQVAADVETEPLMRRRVPSVFNGAYALSAADSLWVTTSRYYTEVALHGKRSLRDFAYLVNILKREDIDWDIVVGVSSEYKLYASLYYYLSFLHQVMGSSVPLEVLRILRPDSNARVRDWGWQLGPLFNFLEPNPLEAVKL
jgi:hypothetical protein